MERDIGPQVRAAFVRSLAAVSSDITVRHTDRAYLRAMAQGGSAEAALRGAARADEGDATGIDALFRRSAFCRSSAAFRGMVAFMGRCRDHSAYGAMLVRLQNPNCGFFATERDWRERHGRRLVEDARPMVILAPTQAVVLVYSLDQTVGPPLPEKLARSGGLAGEWDLRWLGNLTGNARRRGIGVEFKALLPADHVPAVKLPGDAGWKLRIAVQQGLGGPDRLLALLHEVAHVLLGHLGADRDQRWPGRFDLDAASAEVEAETVVHLVASRLGLRDANAAYLNGYVADAAVPPGVSIDLIAKVAGDLERMAKGLLP